MVPVFGNEGLTIAKVQRSGGGEGCCMDTVTRMIHSLLLLISNSHDIGYKNNILGVVYR